MSVDEEMESYNAITRYAHYVVVIVVVVVILLFLRQCDDAYAYAHVTHVYPRREFTCQYSPRE